VLTNSTPRKGLRPQESGLRTDPVASQSPLESDVMGNEHKPRAATHV
jgi:hypothetical protein